MDQAFSDDLAAWLKTASASGEGEPGFVQEPAGGTPSGRYVVERTIKDGPSELTEVVRREDGAGPFVRKTFRGDASRGAAYVRLFETQLQGVRLAHAPLVYECAEQGGGLQVVCEYVPGESLRELSQRTSPGIELLRQVYAGLCDATSELHTALGTPLIHRDIKPSNVIVGAGRVALIDLGIARGFVPEATRDTVRYGTPGYAPPEQFGFGQTSVASDIYALGMTLAFCLTGEDPTPALREGGFADPRIPEALRPVLVRATEFDPAARYGSAAELKRDLDLALAPGAVGASLRISRSSSFLRASAALGRAWNVLLAILWGIVVIGCVSAVVDPTPDNARYPTWLLVIEYTGFIMVPGTVLALALFDSRRSTLDVRFLRLSLLKRLLVALGVLVACWALVFAVVFVYGF